MAYTAINSGGSVVVDSKGSANYTDVNPGGTLIVYDDCTAREIKENGGVVAVGLENTQISFVSNVLSGATLYDEASIHSGTTLTDTTLDSKVRVYVYSGGIVSKTTLNNDSASISCFDAGTLDSITVSKGAICFYSGGTLDHTTLSSGGYLSLQSATADNTTLYGGKININQNGTADHTTVNDGTVVVWSSGTANNTVVSAGSLALNSGTVNSTTLYGGNMSLVNGATANSTFVSGGVMDVSSGTATVVKVYGGTVNVFANGTATGVAASGGTVNVSNGAVLTSASAQDGRIRISSGGTAVANRATKSGRILAVRGGALLSCFALSSGRVELEGGAALATEVGAAGIMLVEGAPHLAGDTDVTNGVASNTRIHLGAVASIGSGGAMIDTVVGYSSASLDPIRPGKETELPSILLQHAGLYVNSSGIASGVTASKGAIVAVGAHGMLVSAKLSSGASAQVMAGGSARTLNILRGGSATVNGAATDLRIANAANAVIGNGGSAATVTVSTGGTLRANAGAKLSDVSVAAGGIVTGIFAGLAEQSVTLADGILDFDVSALGADDICVEQLNTAFAGTYSCTLTIGDTQANGVYRLAADAAGFAKTITVQDASGEVLGTLDVGGTASIGGVDYTLNLDGDDVLSVTVGAAVAAGPAKSDIDGNGISDVLFVWTGEHGEGNYQHGYWMNGTDLWQSADAHHPSDWDNLGCYDMTGDGKADSVLFGNVNEDGIRGAYIGYYTDGNDLDDNWVTIGYLDNIEVDWKNKVGNLTGNEQGANSIVWYTAEMHALGAWKDGKEDWVSISDSFGSDWTLIGCGDFDGDGRDSIMMSYNGGQLFYTADIDGTTAEMGDADWSGWEVRAIGDFMGDGKDDLVLFHPVYGSMVMLADGRADVDSDGNAIFIDVGQLSASDWFVVGAGDYDGDKKDDLLVRQYSTGWLGYYSEGIQANWNLLGRGVGMEWTVIA